MFWGHPNDTTKGNDPVSHKLSKKSIGAWTCSSSFVQTNNYMPKEIAATYTQYHSLHKAPCKAPRSWTKIHLDLSFIVTFKQIVFLSIWIFDENWNILVSNISNLFILLPEAYSLELVIILRYSKEILIDRRLRLRLRPWYYTRHHITDIQGLLKLSTMTPRSILCHEIYPKY